MPAEAVEAWNGPGKDVSDPRVRAIAFALLAPNPHNKQPWTVDLREAGAATFYVDRDRLLPETDPPSRQITIGCGAFLELLRMAAAEQGYDAQVALFPNGAWAEGQVGAEPLARVTFVQAPGIAKDPLFAHVLKRQTNRGAFDPVPMTSKQADALADAVRDPAVQFGWTSDPTDAAKMAKLRNLAAAAWRVEVSTDRTYQESVDVMRITADEIRQYRDGISLHGPFFWWMNTTGMFTRETAMNEFGRSQAMSLIDGQVKGVSSFAWLVTEANDRATQLASGRAYLRSALAAAGLGLTQHPLSQALQEFPEMVGPYQEIKTILGAPQSSTVQMFYRVGTAVRAEFAPRRRLDDILRT
jgi:fermentation-respiration switch protein FrsA (DUF1100 family)